MEEWDKEGWLPGNGESPQPQRAQPHLGQQFSISLVILCLNAQNPHGMLSTGVVDQEEPVEIHCLREKLWTPNTDRMGE